MPAASWRNHVVIAKESLPRVGGGGAVTVERDAGRKVAAAFKKGRMPPSTAALLKWSIA
jgi:hypothetical protein